MSVTLLIGDDPVLLGEAVGARIGELIGDGDRSLMLEILADTDYLDDNGAVDATRLVVAGATPPFLTERRVVVARALARFSRKNLYSPIIDLVGSLLDSTDLVLVWEKPTNPQTGKPEKGSFPSLPKAIREAVELAAGVVTDTRAPKGRGAPVWLRQQLAASGLKLDREAVSAAEDLLGEDRSAVVGLLRTLEGALGAEATVTAADIDTYGGSLGPLPPWDLDNAIDRGDVAGAVAVVHRLIPLTSTPAERNTAAFRLISILQRRYSHMLRLDGAGARDEKEAAGLLGLKGSTYPAKVVLNQSRRLGSDAVAKSVRLLADADLSLRGTTHWPPELVIEVLVARLAAIARRR